MLTKIRTTVDRFVLIRPGDSILVGVSGGADSVALLAALHQLRHPLGIRTLSVLHVNHQLRRGAGADQKFVEVLCAGLRIPCRAVKVRVKTKTAVEEQARELRYAALHKEAERVGAEVIAVGHHRDDLVETVLMRLLRGTGLLGLQGILPNRVVEGRRLIRPLLEVGRDDVLSFLKQNSLTFREDPTNAQTKFFRNRIRCELLPLLEKEYNPQIRAHLVQLAETAGTDYAFLAGEAERLFRRSTVRAARGAVTISLAELHRFHPSLLRLILRRAVQTVQGDLNRLTIAHMHELEDLVRQRPDRSVVDLPAGISVVRQGQTLVIRRRKAC